MCKDNELHGHSHGEHHEHEEGHPHSGSDGHEHQHAHPHGSEEGHEHTHDHSHDHEHKHSHPHSDDHDHGSEHTHTEAHAHEHSHEHAHPHPHKHEHPHPHGGEELGHAHPHPHGQGHCGKHGENGAKCPNQGDVENKDIEILGLLLDHWVTHNQDHAMEYNTWVEKMNRLGKNDVAESLIEAIALMSEADKHLIEAKKELD